MTSSQSAPQSYIDITMPNGKTARATMYTDGTVSQGSALWTAEQWEIGKAKMLAVGAKINVSTNLVAAFWGAK